VIKTNQRATGLDSDRAAVGFTTARGADEFPHENQPRNSGSVQH